MTSPKHTVVFFVIAAAFCYVLIKAESFFQDDIEKNNTIYDSNEPRGSCEYELENCEKTGGICVSNKKGDEMTCKCPGDSMYYSSLGCIGTCTYELKYCEKTGGICLSNENGEELTCKCPLNTTYQDFVGCRGKCGYKLENCENTGGICLSSKTGDLICKCPVNTLYDVTVGCKGPTELLCFDFTCYNGGFCKLENGEAVCICRERYYGYHCEIFPEDECKEKLKECVDTNGKCKVVNEDGKIECECSEDNKFVESRGCLSPAEMRCIDFPCYNGGKCNGEREEAECTCLEGFSGNQCEIFPKSECEKKDKKCAATDGQCISTAKQHFICECPKGTSYVPFDGCKDLCEDFVCYNGGECKQGNGVAQCSCVDGYTGKKCEKFSKEKCEEEIEKCAETNGICISEDEATVNCACKKGYIFVIDEGCQKIEDINCKEICGDSSEVICGGIKKNKEKIKCLCKNRAKDFDAVEKECKTNYCTVRCGDVHCLGNKFEEDEIECSCSKPYEVFDEEAKKCKTNYCKKKCGTAERVECEAKDKYNNSDIKCLCNETDYVFKDKKCIRISTPVTTLKITSTEMTTSSPSTPTSESIITELIETFRIYIAVVGIMIGLLLLLQFIKVVILYRKLKKDTNGRYICTEKMLENASIESTGIQRSENFYSEVNLDSVNKNQKPIDREICSTEKSGNRSIHSVYLSDANNSGQVLQGRNSSSKISHNQSKIHQPSGSKELNTMQYDNKAYDL